MTQSQKWLVCQSDIVKHCNTSGVIIKLFADDLKAYYMSKSHNNFSSSLQTFIDKFSEYCKINGLTIAPKKCNVLHIGSKNSQSKYFVNGTIINTIENKQPIRDLGLYFRSDLKWDLHIDITIKKARRTSYAILKSIKTTEPKLLVEIYKTFIRPTLEFATNVYNPYLLKDIHVIEKVQKDFLKIAHKKCNWQMYKENKLSPVPCYTELLAKNNLETLELRRLKSDLLLFHKYLHGEVKINCRNPFECRETKTRGERYKIFPVSYKTFIRHNSFFVRTSRLYRLLPSDVRPNDVKNFKIRLNNYCLTKYLKCKL